MHPITKKQKIQYILAAAGFVLLALALLFLLLQGPSGGKSDADAAPTPEVTGYLTGRCQERCCLGCTKMKT